MNIFIKPKFKLFRWSLAIALLISLGASATWAWLVVGACLAVRGLHELQFISLPYRWLTVSLSATLFILTYFEFGTFIGLEAATTLVFGLTGFKLLETRTQRDLEFLQLLVLSLLGISLLSFSEFYYLFPVMMGLGLMLLQWMGVETSDFRARALLLKLIGLSLPLTVLMFLVFPRLDNQIIFAFQPARQAVTGFSEEVKPGWIEQLEINNSLMFRVATSDFTEAELSQMLWKGLSLDQSDGFNWTRSSALKKLSETEANKNSITLMQKKLIVLLEPHNERWIFSPSGAVSVVSTRSQAFLGKLGDLFYRKNLEQKDQLTITVTDQQQIASEELDYLQHKPISSELKKWLDTNFDRSLKPEQIALSIKELFQKEFKYTLKPKVSFTMQDFLLTTREGFCEHYSGSAATILRYLGVPARLAIGFKGATRNNLGEFWSVQSGQAHAWVEFKNSKGLWQSFDPTPEVGTSLVPRIAGSQKESFSWKQLWSQTQDLVQWIDYKWSRLIIEFNRERQQEIFSELKTQFAKLFLVAVSGFIIYLLAIWMKRQRRLYKSISNQVQSLNKNRELISINKEINPETWLYTELLKAKISPNDVEDYILLFRKEVYLDQTLSSSELRRAFSIYRKVSRVFL